MKFNIYTGVIRVSKKKLIGLIAQGAIEEFIICPIKCSPLSDFAGHIEVKTLLGEKKFVNREEADKLVTNLLNHHDYYNCNRDTGYHTAFYIDEKYKTLKYLESTGKYV